MNKQARRLYVGNLPDTNEQEVEDFFNQVMQVGMLMMYELCIEMLF
jgi:RNA recognition motif-containing protein